VSRSTTKRFHLIGEPVISACRNADNNLRAGSAGATLADGQRLPSSAMHLSAIGSVAYDLDQALFPG